MQTENQTPDAESPDSWSSVADIESLIVERDNLLTAVGLLKDEMLRERAEIENQRKRLAREIDIARKFANERLLSELLPVFDSLDAGLAASGNDDNPLKAGLDLTHKQLLKVASDNGLVVINPVGQEFNPDQHQAISQEPAGGAAAGSVLRVFQKGYLLNERLLRPALVVVAAAD